MAKTVARRLMSYLGQSTKPSSILAMTFLGRRRLFLAPPMIRRKPPGLDLTTQTSPSIIIFATYGPSVTAMNRDSLALRRNSAR
ncbi:hypothetical protein CKAH01_11544 [Colletotrichum kahawae]|uniref:Uncharacterized protein n=1 Tax=Colletotrichum kahawae TaxID=34407 RepID=A0AAD9YUZ6_COLKA|nr:hypothetical protein CKAH01_11544 [Colletotrichum kahawae]